MSVEPDDLETRPSLLVRVRDASDDEAWRRFVGVYGRLILAECRRRGLKWDDAEDVAQLVLTRVFRSLRSFDYRPDRGRFRDWLGTVVRNEVRRFQKRQQPRAGDEPLNLDDLADNDPAWNEAFARHILAAGDGGVQAAFRAANVERVRGRLDPSQAGFSGGERVRGATRLGLRGKVSRSEANLGGGSWS